MARKPVAAGEIVKLKVTLAGVRPPTWRRLLVPADMTLADLHDAIQASMGWLDGHLHEFDIGFARYGDRSAIDDVDEEADVTLADIIDAGVKRFRYTYDFGDDWLHQIAVEATSPPEEGQRYPACVGGKSACPPEDCGGPVRLAELREIRADPSHPDHADVAEWLAQDYDHASFSVAQADARLATRFSRRKARR